MLVSIIQENRNQRSITLDEFAKSDAAFTLLIKEEVKKLNESELGGKKKTV